MNAGADDTNTEQPNHATDSNHSNETHQDHHKRDRAGKGGNDKNRRRNGRSADAAESTTETHDHHSHDQQDKIKSEQNMNKGKGQERRLNSGRNIRPISRQPHTEGHKHE